MGQIIDIPGAGHVEFPDGMSDDAITHAIETDILPSLNGGGRGQRGGSTPGEQMLSATARGTNKGLTDFVGAPVDLVNAGMGAIGLPVSDDPFGGSKSVRRGLDALAHMAGMSDEQKMAYESVKELPREYRAYASAGEAIGNSLPVAAGIGAAARGVNLAARAAPSLNPFAGAVEQAARNPRAFAAAEGAAASGGAQGAFLAQDLNPDSEVAGPVGQIVGSIASPASALVAAGRKLASGAGAAAALVSPSAAEGRAARHLGNLINEVGEDPQAMLRGLDASKADPLTANLPVADRTGSPTILGLQERLAEGNPDLAQRIDTARTAGLGNMRDTVATELGGDPMALRNAAANEAGAVSKGVSDFKTETQAAADEIVAKAQADATEAANRFQRDPNARGDANLAARDALDQSWEEGKAVEKSLWSDIDMTQRVAPDNFRSAVTNIKSRLLPGEQLPQPVRNAVSYLTSPRVKSVTVGALQNTRSRLLELARDASSGANPDMVSAGIYRRLSSGLLDDMATVPGAATARDFSRRFHDTWDRTFAGRSRQMNAAGADRVPEAMTVEDALSGSPQARAFKLSQQREAGLPLQPGMTDNRAAIGAAQESVIRDDIAGLRAGDGTGRFTPSSAESYLKNNAPTLQSFPAVEQDLRKAVGVETQARADSAAAQASAAADIKNADRAQGILEKQSAFGKVLGRGENPGAAVSDVLRGDNPADGYAALGKLAAKGGDDAVAGLRSATLDHAFAQAQKGAKQAGGFWQALHGVMTSPVSTGGPTLMQAMRSAGAMTATQQARLQQIMRRAVQFERAPTIGRNIKDAGPMTGLFVDQMIRTLGANYGSGLSVFHNAGASLSAASYGSRVATHLFERMPMQRVTDVLQKALEDEALMRRLLGKVKPGAEVGLTRAIGDAIGKAKMPVAITPRGATIGGVERYSRQGL